VTAAGTVTITPGEVLAHQQGSVGWLADRPTFTFADGSAFRVRFTAVARLEQGVWKLVQSHTSVGVPNEDLVGTPLPT
jgi:hypothetical protein